MHPPSKINASPPGFTPLSNFKGADSLGIYGQRLRTGKLRDIFAKCLILGLLAKINDFKSGMEVSTDCVNGVCGRAVVLQVLVVKSYNSF